VIARALKSAVLVPLLFLIASCAAVPPVPMTPFYGGEQWIVTEPISYRVGKTNYEVIVPAGFVTDFASTPRSVWSIFPPFGKYMMAATVHDFLYWNQPCLREQADALFLAAMIEDQVPKPTRWTVHGAVRAAGEAAWEGNKRERAAGLPRIIPKGSRKIPALLTWPEYRQRLKERGVTVETKLPVNYCDAAKFVIGSETDDGD
jgi:hypothetical protein